MLQDGNAGLVKLALSARTMRAIQKLTQTYLTLSLADIAAQVGLGSAAEAEQHILQYAPAPAGHLDGLQKTASVQCADACIHMLHQVLNAGPVVLQDDRWGPGVCTH